MVANAPNYTECQFKTVAKYHGKWDWITVTIQKLNGKTPHQLRMELLERLKFMVNTPVITPQEMEETKALIEKHAIVTHNK